MSSLFEDTAKKHYKRSEETVIQSHKAQEGFHQPAENTSDIKLTRPSRKDKIANGFVVRMRLKGYVVAEINLKP